MLLENCPCPLCGFAENAPFAFENFNLTGEELRLGINQCKNCRLVYVSPRLSEAGLTRLYSEHYESSASGKNCIDESIQSEENQAFYNYVLSSRPQGGTLLDIGCGVGNFLVKFKNNPAFTIQGVELSEYAALEAKKKGLAVIQGDVRSLNLPAESYDLISMLYILEHVPDPVGLLKQVEGLLRPGGLALIAVPNYYYLRLVRVGLASRLLFRKSTFLQAQEHLVNFTPQTLAMAVREANLIPWKYFCGSPAAKGNWLRKALRSIIGIGLKGLFYLGVHLGRIHLLARKTAS